jgi:hypothetical protein
MFFVYHRKDALVSSMTAMLLDSSGESQNVIADRMMHDSEAG